MCLMITKHEPSSTRLINIPVTYLDKKYKLLIYTNDLVVKLSNEKGVLMVVPFPKKNGEIGLVDVNNNKMKNFRNSLFRQCEMLKPDKPKSKSYGNMFLCANKSIPKMVHDVGNYRISVANSFEELMGSIDWDQFVKPFDFEDRVDVMRNKELYPEEEYFYVVAQAQKNVKNDGFGVVYPDCGYDYFPTAHEKLGNVYYDVNMYNMFDVSRPFIIFDNMYLRSYTLKDEEFLHKIFNNYLPTNMIMADSGEVGNFEIGSFVPRCNFFEMKEMHNNGNVIIDKNCIDFSVIQKMIYKEDMD